MYDRAKAILTCKFTVMNAYTKKSERFQINNPMIYLKSNQKLVEGNKGQNLN
jgi:hypothetical protein